MADHADARPYEDRDGDGNPNDPSRRNRGEGGPDALHPYDVIWAYGAGGRPSAFYATVARTLPMA